MCGSARRVSAKTCQMTRNTGWSLLTAAWQILSKSKSSFVGTSFEEWALASGKKTWRPLSSHICSNLNKARQLISWHQAALPQELSIQKHALCCSQAPHHTRIRPWKGS